MKTKTSHLGFLLATLCGLAIGLKLASRVGGSLADSGAKSAVQPANDTLADDERSGDESSLSQPERPAERDRRRPGPDRHDPRFAPRDGETCIAFSVESADGKPLSGARAALFAVASDRPQFPAAAESKADPGGIVYARTPLVGEVFVLAFAPGFLPLARRVRTTSDESLELAPLVLQRGETIRGRVTAGGVALPRAEVEATVETTGDPAGLDGGRIAWRLGHFAWSKVSADTKSDGSYELAGLETGDHTLRIHTVRQRDAAVDVSKVKPVHALAPAQGADFELPAARLELAFKTATAPLCCVEVQIDAGDRQYTRRTDEDGRIAMLIQPALAYPVTAARGGYTTMHTQLRGLSDGEHSAQTIELEPQHVLATVIVDDQGTGGSNEATFVFHSRFPSSGTHDFERTLKRDPGSGRFVVDLVPSGPWRVTMRSGSVVRSNAMDQLRPPIYTNCDADFVVDVPDSGTVTATTTTVPRGCVRIGARDVAGSPVGARARLFDPRGDEIDAVLVTGRENEAFARGEVGEIDPSTYLFSSMCGGSADLVVFHEGYESATLHVVLRPGQVTPVDVVLRAN